MERKRSVINCKMPRIPARHMRITVMDSFLYAKETWPARLQCRVAWSLDKTSYSDQAAHEFDPLRVVHVLELYVHVPADFESA